MNLNRALYIPTHMIDVVLSVQVFDNTMNQIYMSVLSSLELSVRRL